MPALLALLPSRPEDEEPLDGVADAACWWRALSAASGAQPTALRPLRCWEVLEASPKRSKISYDLIRFNKS